LHTIAESEVKAGSFIETKTTLDIKMGQMGEFGSAQRPVACLVNAIMNPRGSLIGGKFTEQLGDCWLLKDSVPCISLLKYCS
jgi:hypothetical protein